MHPNRAAEMYQLTTGLLSFDGLQRASPIHATEGCQVASYLIVDGLQRASPIRAAEGCQLALDADHAYNKLVVELFVVAQLLVGAHLTSTRILTPIDGDL